MSVNAQEFAPLFQEEALLSSAIKCIRRVKLDANTIGGAQTLYGILTSTGEVYAGYSLWRLSKVELGGVPDLDGWSVVLDTLQMFVVQVNQAGDKAPLLVISGYYTGGSTPYGNGTSFVVSLPLLEPLSQNEIYTPSGTIQFPSRLANYAGGSSGRTPTEHVDVVGYYGNSTNDLLEFGFSLGWLRGPFSQLGRDSSNYGVDAGITFLESAWVGNSQRVIWEIESPNTHPCRGWPIYGGQVSMMGLPQDDALSFGSFAAHMGLWYGLRSGEKLSPENVGAQESLNFRVMAGAISLDGGKYVLTHRNCLGQLPVMENFLSLGGNGIPLPLIPPENRTGSFYGVSLGWGLSGLDVPPDPPSEGVIYGAPSLVFYGFGGIAVFGDGEVFIGSVVNDYGESRIRSLVCSYSGSIENPFPASGDAFYNGGIVVVVHRQVYYVMSPSDLASVVSTPNYEYADMPAQGINESLISVSLERLYPETNVSGYADGWWLVATYINTSGRKVVDVAFSESGSSWTQEAFIDLTDELETAYPGALAITHQGLSGLGSGSVPSIAKVTTGMIFVASGAVVTKADTTIQPVSIQVKRTTTSSGFEVSITEGSSSPFFNVYSPSLSLVDGACPDVYLLSGDGKLMTRISHTGAADQQFLDCAAPTSTVDSLGFGDAYEWHLAETSTLFGSGIVADYCRPYLISGTWTPVCFKQGYRGSYVFVPLPGSGVEVVRFVETVAMEATDGASEYVSAKDHSLAFHSSTPDLGTILFLRGPYGDVGHVAFSDLSMSSGYSSPAKLDLTRPFLGFMNLGFMASDLFVLDVSTPTGSVSEVYLTDVEGYIRKLQLTADPATYHGEEFFTSLHTFDDNGDPSLDSQVGDHTLTAYGGYTLETGQGVAGSCGLVMAHPGVDEGHLLMDNPETVLINSISTVRIEMSFKGLDQTRQDWKPLLRVEFDNGKSLEIVYIDKNNPLSVNFSNQDNPAGTTLSTSSKAIYDGEFHHLRLEFHGNTARLGLDGELVDSQTGSNPAWPLAGTSAVTSAIYVGGSLAASAPSGVIDGLVIQQGQDPWTENSYSVDWFPSALGIPYPKTYSDCSFEVVSAHFLGKKNLRLAHCDGIWVATYNEYSELLGQIQGGTYIKTSPDLITWAMAFDGSNFNARLQDTALDVIPIKGYTRQLGVSSGQSDPDSVFLNLY